MRKTVKKVITTTILGFLVMTAGIFTVILFPQPLFANKFEYGKFTVYSNDEIDLAIKKILDKASNLVENSELYDPGYRYDLFFCYNTFYNKIDDLVLGRGPSARATDNNLVIKIDVDVKRDLYFRTFYQRCEKNLSYLIAHEMIHCLQAHKYGKLKFNTWSHPEIWKLEGYPEYISRQDLLRCEDYNLATEIENFLELESKATDIWISIETPGCKVPKYYYKGRLMTEYLMDIKSYSYHEILADSRSEEEVFNEMVKWKETRIYL